MSADTWRNVREVLTIVCGFILLIFGVSRSDSAMMMVGGGLVGFTPATKGP